MLPLGLSITNSIKACFYRREARIYHRLKFVVGENILPVVLNPFTHEFANVLWIDALQYAVLDHLEWRRRTDSVQSLLAGSWEARRSVPQGVHYIGADETRTKN